MTGLKQPAPDWLHSRPELPVGNEINDEIDDEIDEEAAMAATSNPTRPRPVLALVIPLLLALTACAGGSDLSGGAGGGGEEGGDGGGGDGGLQTVRVSETAGIPMGFLSYGVQEGHFEAQGLRVQAEPSAGGATVIPALVNGDIDVAGSNLVSVLIAISKGLPLKVIAAGTSTADNPEEDFSGIVVPADSPIRRVEDLRGARIGVNTLQNINDVVISRALEKRGVDPGSVEFVEIPFPDMAAAIEKGDVDAGLLIEPFLTTAVAAGLRPVVRPYTDMLPGMQIGAYVMTNDRIQEDPDLVKKYQAGVQATAEAVTADPEAFRASLPKLGNVSEELAPKINLARFHGTTDRESVEQIKQAMLDYGLIDKDLKYEDVVAG